MNYKSALLAIAKNSSIVCAHESDPAVSCALCRVRAELAATALGKGDAFDEERDMVALATLVSVLFGSNAKIIVRLYKRGQAGYAVGTQESEDNLAATSLSVFSRNVVEMAERTLGAARDAVKVLGHDPEDDT